MNFVRAVFAVENYDLAATLASGQAFRWRCGPGGWTGVVDGRWVRLRAAAGQIAAETASPVGRLAMAAPLPAVGCPSPGSPGRLSPRRPGAASRRPRLRRAAPAAAGTVGVPGLVYLFLHQTDCANPTNHRPALPAVRRTSARSAGEEPAYSFPGYARLAEVSESDLRGCKLGFRAPYLRGTAQKLAAGEVDLGRLSELSLDEARAELLKLPGVGVKIADCVLLFAYGFPEAFPVDVWIMKALRRHYFPRRSVSPARLRRFIRAHFGPHAGYAQQYLFHYMRVIEKSPSVGRDSVEPKLDFMGRSHGSTESRPTG